MTFTSLAAAELDELAGIEQGMCRVNEVRKAIILR